MIDDGRVILHFSSGQLRIEPSSREWYQVTLVQGNSQISLGAERLSYITSQLIAFLKQLPTDVCWIFSLAERHCAAYGAAKSGGGAILYVQDSNAKPISEIMITEDDRLEWLEALGR